MQHGYAEVISDLERDHPYHRKPDWKFINIVGKVVHDFPHNTLYAVYTPTTIRNKKSEGYSDDSGILPWVLISIFGLILVGGGIIGYRKYKRDRGRTNYIEFRDL